MFLDISLVPLWCQAWGRCCKLLLVVKSCACPLLVWPLGEQSGRHELPPCDVLPNPCHWEGRRAGQVAGLCFRDKSFREPELSRKKRKWPKRSFSAGAQIQTRHRFSLLHICCQPQQPSHVLLKGLQSWVAGDGAGDTESLLRAKYF